MLTQTMSFYDINYGEFAGITGTNLNTATALYAYDNRSDSGLVTWNSTTGNIVYTLPSTISIDSVFIAHHNWKSGFIGYPTPDATLLIHFDEAGSTSAFTDSSLNAYSITAYGDVYHNTTTKVFGDSSAHFVMALSTTATYLLFSNTSIFDFGINPFTIDFRINFDYLPPNTLGFYNLLDGYLTTTSDSYTIQYVRGTSFSVSALYININLGYGAEWAWFPAPSVGIWYHLVLQRDLTAGAIKVTVNGSTLTTISSPTFLTLTCTSPMIFGAQKGATAGISYRFRGYLDELRVINGQHAFINNAPTPINAYTNTANCQSIIAFSSLTTSTYFNSTSSLQLSSIAFSFTETQDGSTGYAGEIIATKKKFSLNYNPSIYSPKLLPIGVEKELFTGHKIWNEIGDHFTANIGWDFLLGDLSSTATDLYNMTELARTRASFLFQAGGGSDSNIRTYRPQDIYKCKLFDGVSYEFPSPAIDYALNASFRIEEVK